MPSVPDDNPLTQSPLLDEWSGLGLPTQSTLAGIVRAPGGPNRASDYGIEHLIRARLIYAKYPKGRGTLYYPTLRGSKMFRAVVEAGLR